MKTKNIYLKDHNLLIDLTLDFIKHFLKILDKEVKIVLSSDIKTDLKGLDKILYILKNLNATKYISGDGDGSKRYIDEKLFSDQGIELVWQNYKHPIYKQQFNEFIPYMSILDLLFNEGPNSKNII